MVEVRRVRYFLWRIRKGSTIPAVIMQWHVSDQVYVSAQYGEQVNLTLTHVSMEKVAWWR